jgi:NADH-quinone oxidoreductase subunit A
VISPILIVAYLLLFGTVAFLFLWVAMLLGRLLRPNNPTPQKQEPYECGEPPVGSGFVQFDLRFYVVALVFIIFEVEVALFFPPAVVFGKATQMMQAVRYGDDSQVEQLSKDLGGPSRIKSLGEEEKKTALALAADDGRLLGLASMADLGVFFAVVLVGFAYVWWRGDLNWVRAITPRPAGAAQPAGPRIHAPGGKAGSTVLEVHG